MSNWEILGIQATTDEDEIRRAYMMELAKHHPEDDPEGFAKLRNAYEEVLRDLSQCEEFSHCEKENEEEVEDTPVSRWIQRVGECYEDYPSRINEEVWKELLNDEVCYQLDEAEEASEKLLVYLMDHFRLPQAIWQLMDHVFHWEDNSADLYGVFPTDFINFVRNSIANEDKIQFDLVEVGLGVECDEVDEWIKNYIYLIRYYNDDDLENIDKCLEEMSHSDIYHPKLEIIRMYYAAHTGREAEAVEMGKAFMAAHPDLKDAYYAIGELFIEFGEDEEGLKLLNQFLEDNPYHFYTHLDLMKYYIGHPEEIMKAEPSVEILSSYYSSDERVAECIGDAYKALIAYYEAQMDLSDRDNKYNLASYYRGIEAFEVCEKLCHEMLASINQEMSQESNGTTGSDVIADGNGTTGSGAIADGNGTTGSDRTVDGNGAEGSDRTADSEDYDLEYGRIYYLLSKIYVTKNDYEKAIEYDNAWIEKATDQDDLALAYEKRGVLYNYLDCYDKALEDFDRVLEINDQNLSVQVKKLYSLDQLKRYQELAECAQHLVDQNYDEGIFYYYLAQGKFYLGEYGEAIDACRENLRINPYEEGAYLIETKIFYNVEQYDDALSVIDTAKSFGIEHNEELLYYEALTLRETRKLEKAAEICQKLTELNKENDKAFYLYARIKNEMGQYEEALELIDESIRLKTLSFKYRARSDVHERLGQYEDAIEDYKAQVRLLEEEGEEDEEEFASAYNNMGYTYANYLRDDEEAFKCYQKAIEYDDEHNRVYNNLGEYYERRKEYEKALECYNKQIEVAPDDYYFVSRGWCLTYMARYEEAKADFESALEYSPENAYAINGIGCIYKRQGQYEEAEEYFRKAIELDEECMTAYENLGNCLNNLEKYNEAIEVYSAALEKRPDREYYYLDRGDMHRYMGEYEEALKDYQLAEDTDNRNYYIYYNRGLAYTGMGELPKAIECFKQVLELNHEHAESYCEIADCYEEMEDYDEAIKWYKKANEVDREYCRSYNNLGSLYYRLHRVQQASEVYEKALAIDPEYRWSMEGMAECYIAWKQYDKAIDLLKHTIELYPKYLLPYKTLGQCFDNLRRYDEGIECIKQALEVKTDFLSGLNELGFLYLNKKELDESISCFEKIIEISPKYAGAYRGLGLVYEKKKEYRKAYEYCVKSAKLYPEEAFYCCEVLNITTDHLKNYEETLELFEGFLEINSENYGLSRYTADVLKELGRKKEAEVLYHKAIEGYKKLISQQRADACTYYNLGQCYKGLEDLEVSKSYYIEAIERACKCSDCNEKGCYDGHYELGKIYEKQEHFQAALTQYRMAASLNLEEEEYKEAIKRMKERVQ